MKIQYSLVLLLTIFSYANGISVTTAWNKFNRDEVIFRDPDDNAILDDTVLQCSNSGVITDAEGKTVLWECAAGYDHSWTNSDQLPYQCNSFSSGDMFLKMNGKECMRQGVVFPTISNNDANTAITSKAQCEDLKADICAAYNAANSLSITSCGSGGVTDQTNIIQYMSHLPQGCTLTHNTGGQGSYSFHWTDTAGASPTDTANNYAINIATDCNAPSSTTGYDVSGLTATFASWDATSVACATGYGGTASVTKCSAIGQAYSLSGCMKPMGQYSTLGSSVGTSVQFVNGETNWGEAAGTHEIYCKSDSTIVTVGGEALRITCKSGYLSADLAVYWDGYGPNPYTTAYSCNPTTGALVVSSSGSCQAAGCTDSAASNYDSSAVYLDYLYPPNGVEGTVCQYDETDKCAQYQSNKISGICINDGRSVVNELSGSANTPTTVKTAGCPSGATTCSAVSAVNQLTGVKINGDNDAYCVSDALVTDTAATASQACDTANAYFKDGDSANTAGTISGYTCSGTTVSAPTGASYSLVESGTAGFLGDYNAAEMGLSEAVTNAKINDGTAGFCGAFWKQLIDACGSDASNCNSAALTAKYQELTGDMTRSPTGMRFGTFTVQSSYASSEYGSSAAQVAGCVLVIKNDVELGFYMNRFYDTSVATCGAMQGTHSKFICLSVDAPPKCEAVGVQLTAAQLASTTLTGSETCEATSTAFDTVTCASGYATASGSATSTGYSCSATGVVSTTDECLPKCSTTVPLGYTGALTNLFIDTFDASAITCNTNYHGVPSVSACSTAGGSASFTGCDADQCNGLPAGYDFVGNANNHVQSVDGYDVTIQCADTHLQTNSLSDDCNVVGNELGGDLSFTAVGANDYTVEGYAGLDPTLKVCKGETYNILRTEAGHALQIRRKFTSLALLTADATDSSSQSFIPANTGTYEYYCVDHPAMMIGEINVADCNLDVSGCSPKATLNISVSVGTELSNSQNNNAVDVSKLVCEGSTALTQSGVGAMAGLTPTCKSNYAHGGTLSLACDANNDIVNTGDACSPVCNDPVNFVDVTDTSSNANSVSKSACNGGTVTDVDSEWHVNGCYKDNNGDYFFNSYADVDGLSSQKPCNTGDTCVQYKSPGYSATHDASNVYIQGQVAFGTGLLTCAIGYSGNVQATCPGPAQDLVFSGCVSTPVCVAGGDALSTECMCGETSCPIGSFCGEDGCKTVKACSVSFYSAKTAEETPCTCGSGTVQANEWCTLDASDARARQTTAPCSAGAGANDAACYCPVSAVDPRAGAGATCTPVGDNDVYCYDTDNDGNMQCSTTALNKPDDYMTEDPGEISTTELDVWLVSHASCGAGNFNNILRQKELAFACIPCDRTVFLNNYNAPYGVKATQVDGKDTLRREQAFDTKKAVVHGTCCVNPHHSVCIEMMSEYKAKCEGTDVSKGIGVQCLDSDDTDGNYDCVMGPSNQVCQNGGTPTGKMVDGCTCDCSKVAPWTGTHCQTNSSAPAALAAACTNDVAITSTCSCEGADRTDGSCDNNGYNPVCVEGGLLKDMTGDTCVCINTVGGTIDVVYKTAHNSASTAVCANGNVG